MKKLSNLLLALPLFTALIVYSTGQDIYEIPKLTYLSWSLLPATLYLVINLIRGHLKLRHSKLVYFILGAWFVSLVLSTAFSTAPELSFWGDYVRFQGAFTQLHYILYFFLAFNLLQGREDQEFLAKTLIGISLAVGLYAIFQVYDPNNLVLDDFLDRAYGTLGQPTMLGQFLLIPIILSVYFSFTAPTKKLKSSYAFITLFLFVVLLLTRNRASILGLTAAFFAFLFVKSRIKLRYKFALSSLVFFALFLFISFFAPQLRSLNVRSILWAGVLKIFAASPFIGTGLETFKQSFQTIADPQLLHLERYFEVADRAHNIFFDTLAQQGIIGGLILIAIFFLPFVGFYKNQTTQKNNWIFFNILALLALIISLSFGFLLTTQGVLLALLLSSLSILLAKNKQIETGAASRVLIASLLIAFSLFSTINSTKIFLANNHYNLGQIHTEEKALEQLEKALELNPHHSSIYIYTSSVLSKLGQANLAQDYLNAAGKITNQDYEYHLNSALLQISLREYAAAEEHLLKAKELAPINPSVLTQLGRVHYLQGHYQEAIQELEYLLSISPNYWEYKFKMDQLPDPEQYRLFFKHAPQFWDILRYLSLSYSRLEQFQNAAYFQRFL